MTTTEERAERLAELLEDDAIPTDGDDVVFDSPWQARLFGLALAFHDRNDEYEWEAFQERLVEAISTADPQAMQEDVEGVYYERWLETLEEFLTEEGILSPEEIERRKEEFAAGERDASEFVAGDPHAHAEGEHDHGHGHEHDH